VTSQSRWVDPTVSLDDIASSSRSMIVLDVRNKLVEIHLVSACGRHEGGPPRNLAGVHDL
jgi:hypothetical protein